MIYESSSEQYIRSVIDREYSTWIYAPAYNLSAILADADGKIGNNIASRMNNILNIANPGIVMQGSLLSEDIRPSEEGVLPTDKFIPSVSSFAYDIYKAILDNHLGYISDLRRVSSLVDFETHGILNSSVQLALLTIYLELYAVYQTLLNYGMGGSSIKPVTESDLGRILNNIRSVSAKIESDEEIPFPLLRNLRDSYRTISFIYKSKLFDYNTLYNDIVQYRNSKGGSLYNE